MAGLVKAERQDLDLRVYFANTKPTDHPLWKSALLELSDGVASPVNATTAAEFEELTRLEKEVQ